MSKKILALVMALVMCLTLVPVSAVAMGSRPLLTSEEQHKNHNDIIFEAWSTETSLPYTAGSYYLTEDVVLSETWKLTNVTLTGGNTINLCLNGHMIRASFTDALEDQVIYVYNGTKLNIYDCGNTAHYFEYHNDSAWVYLKNPTEAEKTGAVTPEDITAETKSGTIVKVTGGCITGGTDGGVLIGDKGNFTMTGGNIVANTDKSVEEQKAKTGVTYKEYGGGITVENNATLTDVHIMGNAAKNNGGGVYVSAGSSNSVNLTNVEIIGNYAANASNVVGGGGMYVAKGIVTMTGGEISGNRAGRGSGGGVYVGSNGKKDAMKVVLTNVPISNNVSPSCGGGVYVYNGSFTMTGGEISGNKAVSGGGVYVNRTEATPNLTAVNARKPDEGGGAATSAIGTASMTDVTIQGNAAVSGGGVYVSGGKITMHGETKITGNNATANGGGGMRYVGIKGGEQSLILGEKTQITGNVLGGTFENGALSGGKADNLCLESGLKVTLGDGENDVDAPENGFKVGVNLKGKVGTFTDICIETDKNYFSADDPDQEVRFVTDHLELCKKPFYTITVANVAYGTVTASLVTATNLTPVTLTVDPAEGYELESLTATYSDLNGEEQEVKLIASGTDYVFTMPAGDVTVKATFKAIDPEAVCTYETKVDAPYEDEDLHLILENGKDGWFRFTAVEGGWKIHQTAQPGLVGVTLNPYLGVEDGKLIYTGPDNAAVWQYKGGAFYITETTKQHVDGHWWGLLYIFPHNKTVTTTYYLSTLTAGDELATGKCTVELYRQVTAPSHEASDWVDCGDGEKHQKVCLNCGEVLETADHNWEDHVCTDCGANDQTSHGCKKLTEFILSAANRLIKATMAGVKVLPSVYVVLEVGKVLAVKAAVDEVIVPIVRSISEEYTGNLEIVLLHTALALDFARQILLGGIGQ